MCGFEVRRNHTEALELDRINENTVRRDTEMTELDQLMSAILFLIRELDSILGLTTSASEQTWSMQ